MDKVGFSRWSSEKQALALTPIVIALIIIALCVPGFGAVLKGLFMLGCVCVAVWFLCFMVLELIRIGKS